MIQILYLKFENAKEITEKLWIAKENNLENVNIASPFESFQNFQSGVRMVLEEVQAHYRSKIPFVYHLICFHLFEDKVLNYTLYFNLNG